MTKIMYQRYSTISFPYT